MSHHTAQRPPVSLPPRHQPMAQQAGMQFVGCPKCGSLRTLGGAQMPQPQGLVVANQLPLKPCPVCELIVVNTALSAENRELRTHVEELERQAHGRVDPDWMPFAWSDQERSEESAEGSENAGSGYESDPVEVND